MSLQQYRTEVHTFNNDSVKIYVDTVNATQPSIIYIKQKYLAQHCSSCTLTNFKKYHSILSKKPKKPEYIRREFDITGNAMAMFGIRKNTFVSRYAEDFINYYGWNSLPENQVY